MGDNGSDLTVFGGRCETGCFNPCINLEDTEDVIWINIGERE